MVTACYIVIYHVADFPTGDKPVRHEDAYQSYDNALLVAKDLAKCLDVVDDVYVIDGLTGEVINTILKDAPQEDVAEEEKIPNFKDSFDDGTGGMWRLTEDNEWDYDCTGFLCTNCVYCDDGRNCLVRDPVTKEERDILIKSAKARVKK